MSGALLVAGTHSDAGKTVITAAICRWLRRRGVSVAPFKAQNMALNSTVTPGGAEIGRAQAFQAAACGVPAEAAMNPVLLKPAGPGHSQVIVMGTPYADATARSYQALKAELREPVLAALADLRARFDVVVCEGAGSPAEINLREGDLANLGLARAADLPVLLVGDIDRGGVFASLYGTLALLEPDDQAHMAGFLINKFRGDPAILAPGLEQIRGLTGRPTYGVLPWLDGPFIDAEDSLALDRHETVAGTLDVAVIRLRWMSNFTDIDALAAEPGVSVRYTRSPADVERADLVVLPGTKATVEDLRRLRADGLDRALRERRGPILGICGGYQMLGTEIEDGVESGAGRVEGLGLLPVKTTFAREKLLRQVTGTTRDGLPARGYEIRHGRVTSDGEPWIDDEGCVAGDVLGTSWHGLLEGDEVRRALLAWVAERRGRNWVPGTRPFADVREVHLDRLGDWLEQHVDEPALLELIEKGAPAGLPVIPPGGVACSVF
jgi:adenosylcobyric acid synthase